MKKLAALALLLCAAAARGQEAYSAQKSDFAVEKNGGLVVPSGYLTIRDETTPLAQQATLTFLGSAITCVNSGPNAATECTVASATGYTTIDNEGTPLTQRATINFLGGGVDCVDDAGGAETDCTITSGGVTDADFLVGTAHAGLSAEIVVGTSPGGELGNTWASPTIDDSLSVTGWTLTTPTISGAITFPDDTTQVFNPAATNAGLNVGSQAGDPSSADNGDIWYDSTANELTARINGANVALGNQTFNPGATIVLFDEFLLARSTASTTCGSLFLWTMNNSGTGAGASGNGTDDGNHPGWCTYSPGTDAGSGYTQINAGGASSHLINGGESMEWMVKVSNLSDGTDGYIFRAGFCDSNAAACTDGLWFEYTHSVNSGNWQINANDGTGVNTANTTTAVPADTWVKLKIVVNSGATSVGFFVNGTEVTGSPLVSKIPTGGSDQTRIMPASMAKTAVSTATARTFSIDYWYFTDTVTR